MLSPVPFLSNGLQRRDAEFEGFRLIEGWFPAGYASPPHCHPRPGFGVVVDGAMEIILRRRRRDGLPGCFGAEPLDDWHRNLVGRSGVHLVVFEIDPARLESCGPARNFLLNGEACRHGDVVLLARRCRRPATAAPEPASRHRTWIA